MSAVPIWAHRHRRRRIAAVVGGIALGTILLADRLGWAIAGDLLAAELLAAMFVMSVTDLRQRTQFAADRKRGVEALAAGDLQAAHAIYLDWATHGKLAPLVIEARHDLGWTLLRQGALRAAVEVLTDNLTRHPRQLRALSLAPRCAVDLALAHALLGELEAASRWLDEAHRRARDPQLAGVPSVWVLARAVILCRSGRAELAAKDLADQEPLYVKGALVRPIRVVRAFAIAAGGPREAGVAAALLATARPPDPSELAFLGAAWPELAAFLASHDLAA